MNKQMKLTLILLFFQIAYAADECDTIIDVLLVLDGSGSISRSNWNYVTDFAMQVIDSYVFGELSANFGLVQFSSTMLSKLESGLTDNKVYIRDLVDKLIQQRSMTDIAKGLDLAVQELIDNGREGVKKMIILLTDGVQNEDGDPVLSAMNAMNAQIEIFVVAVSTGVDENVIQAMATHPKEDHIYSILEFTDLEEIVGSLNNKTCEAAKLPPPPVPSLETQEELVSSEEDIFQCDTEDLINVSAVCNNNGYCLREGPHFACSCMSQFNGTFCDVPTTRPDCTPKKVLPIKSDLETNVSLAFNQGKLNIIVHGNLEQNIYIDSVNYASWTEITFLQDQFYECPYPQSDYWEKLFLDQQCEELYLFEEFFSKAKNCFQLKCYDSIEEEVINCDPSRCTNPPCEKVYKATMNIERGYRRENGRLSAYDDSSNQHDIIITYPWVSSVTSTSSVTIATAADVQSNVLLRSADFDVETNLWNITLKTSVLYPWKLSKGDDLKFGPYTGYLSSDMTGCASGAEECIQDIYIIAPNCDTFQFDLDLASSALLLECNTLDENDCPSPREMEIDLEVTVGATSSCFAEISVGNLEISFITFESDYVQERTSFIGGSTNQNVYFKIDATLDSESDAISSVNLISLKSSNTPDDDLVSDITEEECPEGEGICWYMPSNTISLSFEDDSVAILDIEITAIIEVTFENGAKRSLRRSSQELNTASTEIEVINIYDKEVSAENQNQQDELELDLDDSGLLTTSLCSFLLFLL